MTDVRTGLSSAEVAERVARGQTNAPAARTSRTIGEIVRANVFTVFNALLATLFVIILATGRWQNGLFRLGVIANFALWNGKQVRAKRALDRLAGLSAPRASVLRDGEVEEIDVADVVLDDVLLARTGDQ